MWIKTEAGRLVNLKHAQTIYIAESLQNGNVLFSVRAWLNDSQETLAESRAEEAIEEIFNDILLDLRAGLTLKVL